jgi:hypothetical protein
MVAADPHPPAHLHGHSHAHGHRHGDTAPHPAQPVPWSILRMPVGGRLVAAAAVSAGLWAIVWLALQ